jgi:hypothetical protein
MNLTAEATLTDFLRDPNSIVEQLDRRDVVLHRRNAADLHLSLRSRVESDDEAVGFLARLLARVLADDAMRGRLAEAVATIPWVSFLPADERAVFVDEVVRTAEGAAELGSMAALAQVLIEWKAAAAIHADPTLAIELKRPIVDIGSRIAEPTTS